jgi:GT2 family glycosyltransferase
VPAHVADESVAACFRSLALLQPPPLETILACDGRAPALAALGEAAGMRVVVGETPRGPAHARNRGAAAASGEVLLFLDSDVSAPPDLVARVAQAFRDEPQLSALIGSYDAFPADRGIVSRYRNLLHHFVHQTSNPAASTFWAGCGAIRRADFLALGGFDEAYTRPSIEDIELGYRLRRSGGTIRLAKDVQVTHLKRWSVASFFWTDLTLRSIPWTRLILRERRAENDLNLSTRHRLSLLATLGVCLSLAFAPLNASAGVAFGTPCLAAFLALNRGFLTFLSRQGGVPLALAAVPLHLLHYVAGGIGFVVGAAGWLVESGTAAVKTGHRPASPD